MKGRWKVSTLSLKITIVDPKNSKVRTAVIPEDTSFALEANVSSDWPRRSIFGCTLEVGYGPINPAPVKLPGLTELKAITLHSKKVSMQVYVAALLASSVEWRYATSTHRW